MEANAPSILDELIRPLSEPGIQSVPEGFKSYVNTFIPKPQLEEMFATSPLYNQEFTRNRLASPPLDLHWRNPTGQAGEACNLIKSAHDRLGHACEAYFGLLSHMDSSNMEAEHNRRTLAQLLGVGLGQTMAQLLHLRRVFTLRFNLPANSTSTAETLLKTAYQDNLFKVGCKEQPCLFGENFVDKLKPLSSTTPQQHQLQPVIRSVSSGDKPQTIIIPQKRPLCRKWKQLVPFRFKKPKLSDTELPKEGVSQKIQLCAEKPKTLVKDPSQEGIPCEINDPRIGHPKPPKLKSYMNARLRSKYGASKGGRITLSRCGASKGGRISAVSSSSSSSSAKLSKENLLDSSSLPFREVARHGPEFVSMEPSDNRQKYPGMDIGNKAPVPFGTIPTAEKNRVSTRSADRTCDRSIGPGVSGSRNSGRVFGTQMHIGVIHGSQAEPAAQTSDRFVGSKPTYSKKPLQDEFAEFYTRYLVSRGLDDKSGPEKRLLFGPNSKIAPTLSSLHMEGEGVDVHEDVFRHVPGPKNIHQGLETGCSVASLTGSKANSIHRRFLDSSCLQSEVQGTHPNALKNVGEPRVYDQLEQESHRSGSDDSIPGYGNIIRGDDCVITTSKKGKTNEIPGRNRPKHEGFMLAARKAGGQLGGHSASLFNGSALFQGNTKEDDKPQKSGGTSVNRAQNTTPAGAGRGEILDSLTTKTQTPTLSETQGNSNATPDGCIQLRLGGYSGPGGSLRDMGSTRNPIPHKCQGTSSSSERVKAVCFPHDRKDSGSGSRQHHLSGIHSKKGRSTQQKAVQNSDPNLGISTSSPNEPGNQVYSGKRKYKARPSVKNLPVKSNGKQGVVPPEDTVQRNLQEVGTSEKGSICKPSERPAPSIHNMAGAPLTNKCLPSQMEGRRLRIPTVRLDSQGSTENKARPVCSSADSSELADTELVPITQEHDVRIPTMGIHPDTGPGPSGVATPIRDCSTPGRVASHWKTVEGETISEGVKNYITDHSLSELSKKSYTQKWKQYREYCYTLGLEPDTPSEKSVSDYVLELINRGHSYSSVNSSVYAISYFGPVIKGTKIAHLPLVKQLLKSHYKVKPPQAKYVNFWDPRKVWDCWNVPNDSLSLADLARKTFALISLSKPIRCIEVTNLLLPEVDLEGPGVENLQSLSLRRGALPKTQRSGSIEPVVLVAKPQTDRNSCPVNTCISYMQRLAPLREDKQFLFVSSTKPHRHISNSTGKHWRCFSLRKAGISNKDYAWPAHSYRGAVANYLANIVKLPINEVMRLGNWGQNSTKCFKKHYLRS